MAKYYLTTPIYYVNDVPHVGHLYTTVAADVVARYKKMRGHEVYFLTGTDENSQKNVEAAAKKGYDDVQKYLDDMAGSWRATWEDLGIGFDDFIRTTEPRHKAGVEKFWLAVKERNPDDIYQGEYEGFYCTGCEAFKTETELEEGNKCPIHKKEVSKLKEKNWFFRLSKYRQALLDHIDANPTFVSPESRRNEVRSYVDKFMEDVSISRETVKWGIRVPGDENSVIYVWFDALINYLTGIGYGTDDAMFEKWWPADVHLVGKDIIKFHCALWPAMLLSAGLPLPKQVFAHGFFTIDGEKMSKSLGNVVEPRALAGKYGMDVVRFHLLKEIPFGADGDFSEERLKQRYSGELGNTLGNLMHRVLSMTEKYAEGKVPAVTQADDTAELLADYERAMDELSLHQAVESAMNYARVLNGAVDEAKPWELAKTAPEQIPAHLYRWLEGLRRIAWMLRPIMPGVSDRMFVQLGLDPATESAKKWEDAIAWGGLQEGGMIAKGEPLFPRLEA